MESTPYGAVEACVGCFTPVADTRSVRESPSSDSCGCSGLEISSNSQSTRSFIRQSGSFTKQRHMRVSSDLFSLCASKAEHSYSPASRSREDEDGSHHAQQQLSQLLKLEHSHTPKSSQPLVEELEGEKCEVAFIGVDIPEACAHITCLMITGALEIYDSSPYPRFLPGPQGRVKTSEEVARAAAVGSASIATSPSTTTAKLEEASAHLETALANAASAVPLLPCLLRIQLAAPLLARTVFDAVLSHGNPLCATHRSPGSGTSRSRCANPHSDSSKSSSSSDCRNTCDNCSDGGLSIDSIADTRRKRCCRCYAAVRAAGSRLPERKSSRCPGDDLAAPTEVRSRNCAVQEYENPGDDCPSRSSRCQVSAFGDCCCCRGSCLKEEDKSVQKTGSVKVHDCGGKRRAKTCLAANLNFALVDKPGKFVAAATSTGGANRGAGTTETRAKVESHSITRSSKQMQGLVGLSARVSNNCRRYSRSRCVTQPTVTISFILANTELHLVHLTVCELSSRQPQQQPCGGFEATTTANLSGSVRTPMSVSAAAPGQLILLVRSHISVMLTHDPLRRSLYVKSELETGCLMKKAKFHPLQPFLNQQHSSCQKLLESQPLGEQQHLSGFRLQHQLMQRLRGQVEQTHGREGRVRREEHQYFDAAEPSNLQPYPPPVAEGNVELESHKLHTPEAKVTAAPATFSPDVNTGKAVSVTQQREGKGFAFSRLLLLNPLDLLLGHQESHVCGILRFRKQCHRHTHGRGKDCDSRRTSNGQRSTRAHGRTRAPDVKAVGTWVDEEAQKLVPTETGGSQNTGKTANRLAVVSGQLRRSVCGRRHRSFKRSRPVSRCMSGLLASVWKSWKRYRASSLRKSSASHGIFITSASSQRVETDNGCPGSRAFSKSNANVDGSSTGTVDFRTSSSLVNHSRERRGLPRAVSANAGSAGIAAERDTIHCCMDSQAAEKNNVGTLGRKLEPAGLLPHIQVCLAGHQREQKQPQTHVKLCQLCRVQRRHREGRSPMRGIYGPCGLSKSSGKGATMGAPCSVSDLPQRSFEKQECISRFLYLLTTAQHVMRLPNAAGRARVLKRRHNNRLLVTCSVVSRRQQQHWRQSRRVSRGLGDDCFIRSAQRSTDTQDATYDSEGSRVSATRYRQSSSSPTDELETDAETWQQGHIPEVVVAVWKVGATHRRLQHTGDYGGVTNSSTMPGPTSKHKCGASTVSSGDKLRYTRTCVQHKEIPFVQLLCKYTYKAAGTVQGVLPSRTLPAASAASSTTVRGAGKAKAQTYPPAMFSQQRPDGGPACTPQKGEGADGSPSTGLVQRELHGQKDGATDISNNPGFNKCAAAKDQTSLSVVVESFNVAPTLPCAAAAERTPTATRGEAVWWIGLAIRSIQREESDMISARELHSSGNSCINDLSEGISNGCASTQGRSSSSIRSADICREILLLRCRAKDFSRDGWKVEKVGQLLCSGSGAWRVPGTDELCSGMHEEKQSNSQKALNKSGNDVEEKSVRERSDGSASYCFRDFGSGATDECNTVQLHNHCLRGQDQRETLPPGDESLQCSDVWKQWRSGLRQWRSESQTKLLLTSTHLWLISMQTPPLENVDLSTNKGYTPQHSGEVLPAENPEFGRWCCCPRRAVWAIPLPHFHSAEPAKKKHCMNSCQNRSAYTDVIRADADGGDTGFRFIASSGDVVTEQGSMWPAGVRPLRVFTPDDSSGQLRCLNMCCSAVRRSRTLEVAKAAEGTALLLRLRAALRSVLRRSLAAVASTALAEPRGPGANAAAAAAAAAAIWNSQPLVADAYSEVFSGAGRNSAEAAAALLDWFALRLSEALTSDNTCTSTMGPADRISAYIASTEAKSTVGATVRSGARHGEGNVEPHRPGHPVATVVTGHRYADLSAYQELQNGDSEPWHGVLLEMLAEYAPLLRGKEAEAAKCRDRMSALLGITKSMSRSATSFSDGVKGRIFDPRNAILCSRVRLLLELLTNAFCRNKLVCKQKCASHGGKHIPQHGKEESLQGGHTERRPRLQQLQREKQGQQGLWSFSDNKLVVASVISLVFCWQLRRRLHNYAHGASCVSPLSWIELGESYVWGSCLRLALTRTIDIVNDPRSLSCPKNLQPCMPCVTSGNSLSCLEYNASVFSTATVEKALEDSPLGCVLSLERITSHKISFEGVSGFDNTFAAPVPSSASEPGLTPSNQQLFGVPLFICRRHPSAQHTENTAGELDSKDPTFGRGLRGSACYSLHVIRPALTAAEGIDWQLQHTLKEVVADMATAAVAVAAEEGGKKGENKDRCSTLPFAGRQQSGIREASEAAEMYADQWALESLMTHTDRVWGTFQQAKSLVPATRERAPTTIFVNSGIEEPCDLIFSRSSSRSHTPQGGPSMPESGYTGVAFTGTQGTEKPTLLSRGTHPFSAAAGSAEERTRATGNASDAEITRSFLVSFFCGNPFHPNSAEQVTCCCYRSHNIRTPKSVQAHRRQQGEAPWGSLPADRATSAAQRQREEALMGRLQHVLNLRKDSASWRLAVAGSLLRLGVAALEEGHEPEGQAHPQPQQELQGIERRLERRCAQEPLVPEDKQQKDSSTGLSDADDVARITAQTGRLAGHGIRYCAEERQRYATTSSEVWKPLQTILETRSATKASPWRDYQIFLASILRYTATALAPLIDGCAHSKQSCGVPDTAAVPTRAGPAALTTEVHSVIETGGSVCRKGDLTDLLRSIRWNALLPVFLGKHVSLQGCTHRAAMRKNVTIDGCRGDTLATLATGAAKAESRQTPLQLDTVCGWGAVLLVLPSQVGGFCTLDTLSDANASALPRSCFPQKTTAADKATIDMSTPAKKIAEPTPAYAAVVARRAAAAAVAVRVGLSCVDLLWTQRPMLTCGASDSPFDAKCHRCGAGNEARASDSSRLCVEEKPVRSVDRSSTHFGNSSILENSEQEDLKNDLLGTTDDEEKMRIGWQQETDRFFSFVNSPVPRLLAEAIATGLAAQHELLCNITAGTSYLLYLRRQEWRRQKQVDSDKQRHPVQNEQQDRMHNGDKKGFQQNQLQDKTWQSQLQDNMSKGSLDASNARKSATSFSQRMPATLGAVSDFLGSIPSSHVVRVEQGGFTSRMETSPLHIVDDAGREGLTQQQRPTENQHIDGGVVQCERTPAAQSENQLLSCILEAVDSSLPLSVGLRYSFCDKRKPCILPSKAMFERQEAAPLLQQPKHSGLQRYHLNWTNVDVLSKSLPGTGTTAAASYCSNIWRAGGDGAADNVVKTSCAYPLTPPSDLKAKRSPHEGLQLLLLLLFCEYDAKHYLNLYHILNRGHRNRKSRDSRRKESGTGTDRVIRECEAIKQISLSDTESYMLHQKSMHGCCLTPDAIPSRRIYNDFLRTAAHASAFRRTSWTECGVPAAGITGAARATAQHCEESESAILLLPWLTRNLSECWVSKTLILSLRIRAAKRLADVLYCSSSILHRLVAHFLRCWIYKQEHCTLFADIHEPSGQYLETTAIAWDAARLLAWLQHRVTALSRTLPEGESPHPQLREQLVSATDDQQERQQLGSCTMPCVPCKKQVTWSEQEVEVNHEHNWQNKEAGTEQAVKEQQEEAEPQPEVHSDMTFGHRRGRQARAEEKLVTTRGASIEASTRHRAADANCWGFYAHLLHQSAQRLQQSRAALAAREVRIPRGRQRDLFPAFEDEEVVCMRQMGRDEHGVTAVAKTNLGRGWTTSHEGTEESSRTAGSVGANAAEAQAADPPGVLRLSLAVALLRRAAQAATISHTLRLRSSKLFVDGGRTGAHRCFRCSATVNSGETPEGGESVAAARGMQHVRKRAVQWLRYAAKPTLESTSGEILLQMCTRMLPSALPDAEALWEAALTAALHDGYITAAVKFLPMLRSPDIREKQLLHILAALLIQQSPQSSNWKGDDVNFPVASGSSRDAWVPMVADSSTPGNSRKSCNNSWEITNCTDPANCRRMARPSPVLESVSLTSLCAAAGSCPKQLSLEGILLRLSLAADCACDGPALAAFQPAYVAMHVADQSVYITSTENQALEFELLCDCRAVYAICRTQLYAATEGQPRTACSQEGMRDRTAATCKADLMAPQYYANMVFPDDCFPLWLLRGLCQLQDLARYLQQVPQAAAFGTSPLPSCIRRQRFNKYPQKGLEVQPNSLTRDLEEVGRDCMQEGGDEEEARIRKEDYEVHIRLMEAAEVVRRLCLTFASDTQRLHRRLHSSIVPIGHAHDWNVAQGGRNCTRLGRAEEGAARDAVEVRVTRNLCVSVERSLSVMENSASFCANILLGANLRQSSSISSFPMNSLVHTSDSPINGVAAGSSKILLLPSVLQFLLPPESHFHHSCATRTLRLTRQKSRAHQQVREQLRRQGYDSKSVPLRVKRLTVDTALAIPQLALTTAQETGKATQCASWKAASSLIPASAPTRAASPELPCLLLSTPLPRHGWTSAAAVAAEAVYNEVLKYPTVPEHPLYLTAALARRIGAIAGAKLRLLRSSLSEDAGLQQLLPWTFHAAETVANLGFGGQLCAAIQLADASHVDVFVAYAAFVAFTVTRQAADVSSGRASELWQQLVQQLRLRRATAASGRGLIATKIFDEGPPSANERSVQMEADVCAFHSKLLQLFINIQGQLMQHALQPLPSFVIDYVKKKALPGDPVAALGQLLREGRLQDAFALVMREQAGPDKQVQQVGVLRQSIEWESVHVCDSLGLNNEQIRREERPMGTSAHAFLNLAWPLLIQLQSALVIEAAEQKKKTALRAACAAATTPNVAALAEMHAKLRDVLARHEEASRLSERRDVQLASLALREPVPDVSYTVNVVENGEVAKESGSTHRNTTAI